MKKSIPALLLIAAMLFSLTACGGSSQGTIQETAKSETEAAENSVPEAADSAEPTAEPEPEKLYARQERQLLVQKRVYGHAASTSRPEGRAFDAVTDYVYDEYGELISENTRYVHTSERNTYYGEAELTRDAAGQIVGEKKTGAFGGLPWVTTYTYDSEGFCTHWTYDWETIGSAEADFSYDEAGRLSFLAVRVNGEGEQTMTPVYENDVQVATKHVAPDGGEVEEFFRYDEQGRLCAIEYDAAEPHEDEKLFFVDYPNSEFRYNPYLAGDKHIEVIFHYGDDDLITEAEWKVDGSTVSRTRYSYPPSKNQEGGIACEVDTNSRGPFLFGYGSDPFERDGGVWWGDKPAFVKHKELTVVADAPRYVETITDYEYEKRNVLVEVTLNDEEQSVKLESLYPPLPETLCGEPVPQPDGSKKLIRAELDNWTMLVAAEPIYLADGSCAGVVNRFDGQKEYENFAWSEGVQKDEQGRISYMPVNDAAYTWSEDGSSYTISIQGDAGLEIHIEDEQIPAAIERIMNHTNWEYNEDGLPVREERGDRVDEYSYFLEHGRNPYGTEENCTILNANDGKHNVVVMVFDADGYLLYYSIPGAYPITYYYE